MYTTLTSSEELPMKTEYNYASYIGESYTTFLLMFLIITFVIKTVYIHHSHPLLSMEAGWAAARVVANLSLPPYQHIGCSFMNLR